MRYLQASKVALVATTSILGLLSGELPVSAGTFAESSAFLRLDEFSIAPQDIDANSDRNGFAFTGSEASTVDANGDGQLISDANSNPFINLDFNSDVTGQGTDYFGLGVSQSSVSSTFFVDSNETLSFNFDVSLALASVVDLPEDGSINNFSQASFALFDETNDVFIGQFIANGNLDTNLTGGIDNDSIGATSNLNFAIDSFSELQPVTGNSETANLSVTGSISQFFATPTQVRLEANTFNRSCSQAPLSSNPCSLPERFESEVAVPEHNGIFGLVVAFLGTSLFLRRK